MTSADFAAESYYSRHDGTADTDAPPERDLTTVRGAASWGLEQARIERDWAEFSSVRLEPAQMTFRHAALDCAGISAGMHLDGHAAHALTWARAYRHLLDLADRADRARVSRAGGAS